MSLSEGDLERAFPDGRPAQEQPRWRHDFPVDTPEDDEVARREFTKFLVLTSGAFLAGQCWIGLMSLLRREGDWPRKEVARLEGLKAGSVVEFRYPEEDDPCLLIVLEDGRLVAYGQKCTHLSCAVIPEPAKGQLRCPCHNGYFEVHEGRPIAGPPRRPLPRITLEINHVEGVVYATGVEVRSV